MPPLRERSEDIPLLVEHFIEYFNEKLQPRIPVRGIEEDALTAMVEYPWPGNVRELSNCYRGCIHFRTLTYDSAARPSCRLSRESADKPLLRSQTFAREPEQSIGTFAEAERELIARALKSTDGNKVQAAALLRISRKKLYAKIEKYGL